MKADEGPKLSVNLRKVNEKGSKKALAKFCYKKKRDVEQYNSRDISPDDLMSTFANF